MWQNYILLSLLAKSILLLHWENSFFESKKHFFDTRSKKKFLWIEKSFVNSKIFPLIQRNRFVYIKDISFESPKLSSIQRNFFFDRISKKCFFDSRKLFSGCIYLEKIIHSIELIYMLFNKFNIFTNTFFYMEFWGYI